MTFYHLQAGFAAGEMSPSLFGRTDLAKYALGASTMRNSFVSYRGGASSRAGLAYVGMAKQGAPNSGGTSTSYPPRDIPFQFNLNQGYVLEFGDLYMRIKSQGAYVTETGKNITAATNASPLVITSNSHGFSNGDWVFIASVGGMTQLNGLTFVVINKTTNTFQLQDLFGNTINSGNYGVYTSGGTASRIFTLVTPYNAVDLPFLKYTQSTDTMSLCLVNQTTSTEYQTYSLVRSGATNWAITATSFTASISAPTGVASTAENSTTKNTYYSYVVTAVSQSTNEESVASATTTVQNNDIAVNAGSNTITWAAVTGANSYNIYAATPSYNAITPVGVSYGYVGSSFAGSFVDTNIIPDFTTTPPTHNNPFARGTIIGINPTAGGASYTQATIGYSITTATGSGFSGTPIVVGGAFVGFYITNGGSGYVPADTITITDSGAGAGATASLSVGPQTGTYPGVVNYYQQRRVYGYTLNNPNTYYMSQPGAYNNMDSSIPINDGDAIIGTPWAQQLNGLQFFQPMPSGLIVLSGSGAWLVSGLNGGPITPADQTANPEAYNGCHFHVQPLVVNYDILYLQSKGSIVRDLSYNFFVNVYTGTDLTILSNHLFDNHQLVQWAYAEEPFKLVWAVRDDGVLLSLTYLKEQDIYAWARHDTNGLFQCVCVVTEPPSIGQQAYVDAPYFIVQRYVNGKWVYYSERMDNRAWLNAEDCFCVDAGLSYPQTYPNATITAAAADGSSNISSVTLVNGGSGYSAMVTATAIDSTGVGTGAVFSVTLSGGVITAITPTSQGSEYTPGATSIVITDTTGSGAVASPVITNYVIFTTDNPAFNASMVGDVIRVGGGKATIVTYTSVTQVTANITEPITETIPNDPNEMPIPSTSTNWSVSAPTATVTGLNHLEGKEVAILADGSVVPNQTVTNGSITLPQAASKITIGLPYQVQIQTLYGDAKEGQNDTPQGKRKNIPAVILRVENSRGFSAGANQPDASVQPDEADVPWTGMTEVKERNAEIHAGSAIPLFTGDAYMVINGDWSTKGQVAVEQNYPLPLNLLSVVSIVETGDTSTP